MSHNKKVVFTVITFVMAMLLIACSCSSLSSLLPTGQPSGTGSGGQPSGSGSGGEAMPGLAGTWQDPESSDTFVIAWQNNQYVVTSVTWEGKSYSITSQNWNGSSLTWSYYDTDLNLTTTYTTTSLSGDTLNTDWSYSTGASGSTPLTRVN